MSNNLIERLRTVEFFSKPLQSEAADELERLTADAAKKAALFQAYEERIAELEAKIDDPSWLDFMGICNNFLAHYPPDIFTGVSGDPGPLFVVALRAALKDTMNTTKKGE